MSIPFPPYGHVDYGIMPYFDELLGISDVEEYLKNETFHPYKFKSGKEARYLSVSESGRWFSLLGGHLPIDLTVGYDKQNQDLFTVNGATIRLPSAAKKSKISRELEEFFEDRGLYYKEKPEHAWLSLYSIRAVEFSITMESLLNGDWGKLRYIWEKDIMNRKEEEKKAGSPVNYSDIFERVLSDVEMRQVVAGVINKKVDVSDFLDLRKYSNEYSVCDGIELLRGLGKSRNRVGIDFLFDCLSDVDEPYFSMAVELLKTFPKEMLEQKIEECAAASHEKDNVEKFGGLLYLAKELDYEIKYVEKMKEKEEVVQGQTMTSN